RAEARGRGADGGDDRALRRGVAYGDVGRRLVQRGEQVVRHPAAEVDHPGGEEVVEVLLPPRVARTVDRHVDRLHRRVDLREVRAEVRRVLGRSGRGGDEGDGAAVGWHGADEQLVDLARLAERKFAAADEHEQADGHGERKIQFHGTLIVMQRTLRVATLILLVAVVARADEW